MIVTYSTSTTFNGYIADSKNSLEWLFEADAAELPEHEDFIATVGAQIMGSTTYEWLIFAQGIMEHPEMWAAYYGDMPVFVLTTRELPIPAGANVIFLQGNVAELAPQLEAATGGKRLWIVGGGDVAGQFAEAGLLNEIVLSVAPAALSDGKPLFTRTISAENLHLKTVEQFGQFARLTYQVK